METVSAYIFYDGVCILCNRSVRWILHRDVQKRIKVAPLDTPFAQERMAAVASEDQRKLDSVLVWTEGHIYDRSDAIIKLLNLLPQPWRTLRFIRIIPHFIRDGVYNVIARFRYRWFGKYDACPMPPPELRDRFYFGP